MAPVAADGHAAAAAQFGLGAERLADQLGGLGRERFADDAANIVGLENFVCDNGHGVYGCEG
jgi:hypothetical protein